MGNTTKNKMADVAAITVTLSNAADKNKTKNSNTNNTVANSKNNKKTKMNAPSSSPNKNKSGDVVIKTTGGENITITKKAKKVKVEKHKAFSNNDSMRNDVMDAVRKNNDLTMEQLEKIVYRSLSGTMSNSMQTRRKNVALSLLEIVRAEVKAEVKLNLRREKAKEYHMKNRERILETKRRYRENNQDKLREYSRMYRDRKKQMMDDDNNNNNNNNNTNNTNTNNNTNKKAAQVNTNNTTKNKNNNK